MSFRPPERDAPQNAAAGGGGGAQHISRQRGRCPAPEPEGERGPKEGPSLASEPS